VFFAPKKVSWREWAGLAAGAVVFGLTFMPWTVLSANTSEIQSDLGELPHGDVARNAWDSDFFSWFPPILLLVAGLAVVLFGQRPAVRVSGLPHLWLIGSSLAFLLSALGWFLIDFQFSDDQRQLFGTAGISINAGFGRYLGVMVAAAAVAFALLDVLAARAERKLPRT
jgi:hypothetical protein